MIKLLLVTISFWIEPCTNPETACIAADPQLARWALQAWQAASNGRLRLVETENRSRAQIQVVWATPSSGLYGETVGKVVNIRIATDGVRDPLLRDTIVYLTCLHESGHALGLPHTSNFEEIMYNFQYGGDIQEYFARYRRKLRSRDDIQKNPGLSERDRERIIMVK